MLFRSGFVATLPVASDDADFVAISELAAMKANQAAMQAELESLRGQVDRLYAELGIARS